MRVEGRVEAKAAGVVEEDLSTEGQKTAEEKLKARLKAKFGDSSKGKEEGESPAKRSKISWP